MFARYAFELGLIDHCSDRWQKNWTKMGSVTFRPGYIKSILATIVQISESTNHFVISYSMLSLSQIQKLQGGKSQFFWT